VNRSSVFWKIGCAPLLASQEENEWPREDHTNLFAHPERTWIVRVHQKSQDQPGAKVEPDRRTTAPDSRAQAVFCRRRHQPRRPPLAKIRPGSPAPTMGPGTGVTVAVKVASPAFWRLNNQKLEVPKVMSDLMNAVENPI